MTVSLKHLKKSPALLYMALLSLGLFGRGLMANDEAFLHKYHQTHEQLQQRFQNANPNYPIIIFNNDEINWRFLTQGALGEDNESARLEIIANYIEEKTGIALDSRQAKQLEPYLTKMQDGAFAMPILEGEWRNRKIKVCAVFPASINSNQQLETERILGLETTPTYQEEGISYENIVPELSFQQLSLFSLYHEISHCLDSEFFASNYTSQSSGFSPSSRNIHQAEAFAETLAYLLLVQDYYQSDFDELSQNRQDMRTIYSRKVGQFLARNPQLGMGDQNFKNGGVIYHLAPFLSSAQDEVAHGHQRVLQASLSDLIEMAVEIVDENSLTPQTFYPISQFLKEEDPSDFLNEYRQMALDSPDLFERAQRELSTYIEYTNEVLDRALRVIGHSSTSSSDELRLQQLNYQRLCTLAKDGEKNRFQQKLTELRAELNSGLQFSTVDQRKRAKDLNGIFEKLNQTCHDEYQMVIAQ